jgi:two-component system phosphate regulon sensor histidine kinase PhoR
MAARLWSGLAVFGLLLLGAVGVVVAGTTSEDHSVDGLVRRLQPLELANLKVRADFAEAQSLLHVYSLTREPRFLVLYRSDRAALAGALDSVYDLARAPELGAIRAQDYASRAWFGYAARMQPLGTGSTGLVTLTNQGFHSAHAFYLASDGLQARLVAESGTVSATGQQSVDHAVLLASILTAIAALLGLVAAVATTRSVTRPLHDLVAVLRRLTEGEHEARAGVTGPAEIREVARSLNALADEGDRLRVQEAEGTRLRTMAREAGLRVREHLRVEDLVLEAKEAIEKSLVADVAYLHIMQNGVLSLPVGHEKDWLAPDSFLDVIRGEREALFQDLLRRNASLVYQDISDPKADPKAGQMPPQIRRQLKAAGIVSEVLVPFGSGSDLLGIIVAARMRKGRPWTDSEVDAVESIAADVGRGLHHARMYEAENRLVQELRAVDQVKSDFLATVSHELRTPLTSIAGYIEILQDQDAGPLTPSQERMLDTVDRNTARLRHLIEDVLTLSKIESGAFKTMMQPVSLAGVVVADVTALQPTAAAKGLTFTWLDPDHGLVVNGDPGQLDRLVMNLLTNAVKFTPEGGRVGVSVECEGTMAVLRVSDTGIGIPEGEQKEMFNRFFRASNAVELSIPGSGLGLAIVRTIVANHHGELEVTSHQGTGTTVTVRIPLITSRGARQMVPDMPVAGGGWPA